MRPTTSTMLQQNNNNNYPCLNMSGSSREMLQKCSRASLPFPSRLELADLPLIRGLRAWALCSKNRHKTASLLGGGQAPAAPPAGRGGSTPCPRPADVYLSEEWGRMGYGLPLGVDGRQAGIGALVTVATLKTSEGSGKTQTQCLFLRTEKGSCLYSAAKPSSGVTASAASSVVGGWLRGKTGGGGCRDTLAGPTPPPQTGANRVRVRSGRRWRKSGNVAGREKTGVSRERRQRSREVPTGESTVEERQEEQDKGGPDCKEFPSLQQDNQRARCCHSVSPKSCVQCGRSAQRRKSQDEREGGIPNKLNGEVTGMRKERQKNEDEEKGDLCKLESSNCVVTELNSDPESTYSDSPGSCEEGEMRETESSEGQKTQTSHSKDAEKDEDTCTEGNNHVTERKPSEDPCEEEDETNEKGFSDHVEGDEESEKRSESAGVTGEKENLIQAPAEFSGWAAVFAPASGRAAVSLRFNQSATPVEGSVCTADHETRWVQAEQESSQNHLDPGVTGEEEVANETNTVNEKVNKKPQLVFKNEETCSQLEEKEASPSPLRDGDASISESSERIVTENSSDCGTTESEATDELQSEDQNLEERLDPEDGGEAGEIWRWECSLTKLDDCKGDVMLRDDDDEGVRRNCASQEDWRLQEFKDGHRRREKEEGCTCAPTSIPPVEPNEESNTACTDPPTSPALSKANPAPPLPTLGSMATGLPCQEEEEEEEVLSSTAGDREGGQEGKRNCRRELEEQGEVESGSAVATDEGRKEEEEDEFGVFMQAEGEPAWSEEFTVSASVPCGSRESAALGKHAVTGEPTLWTPGVMDSSFHRSDDTWTAFPRDSSDGGGDVLEQWWPASAVEERRDGLSANQNLGAVFAEAFPSLTGSSSSDPCDLNTVPTLSQLLRGGASRDQGLLDSFHDLNKMIGQRYKRANGVSRYLLLQTLHLEQPPAESRPAPWTANCRLSPGLPSANRHAQHAAAKRRLSYDYNRNVKE